MCRISGMAENGCTVYNTAATTTVLTAHTWNTQTNNINTIDSLYSCRLLYGQRLTRCCFRLLLICSSYLFIN